MLEVKLSVVIPAYNEEGRLPRTLRAMDEYLQKQDYGYEILVVSDGSQDRTAEVVNELAQEIQNLRVMGEQENHGKGYSVREGMLEARGAYRVFSDADNSTSVDHIEKMWPEFERGFAVVIGSRDIKGAVIAVSQPWWRRRLGDAFNLIVQGISGLWGVWDTQCGFKGFTRKAAEAIFAKSIINGWAFDVELLLLAKKMGYPIKEIPVTWVNDPESKVNFKSMIRMLFEVFAIRKNMMQKKYGSR